MAPLRSTQPVNIPRPPPRPRDPSLLVLSRHHQSGLQIAVLIDRGLKGEPTGERVTELVGQVTRLAESELFEHFEVEETVLFPAVRPVIDSGELLDTLVAGHRTMEELVRRLAAADYDERLSLLKSFGELLLRHIRMEERELFRQVQDLMDATQLEELGRKITAKIEATGT